VSRSLANVRFRPKADIPRFLYNRDGRTRPSNPVGNSV
jgi:hypothetical protein